MAASSDGVDVVTGMADDYQPQLSPDGTKLCFTRQGVTKDVYVAPSPAAAAWERR